MDRMAWAGETGSIGQGRLPLDPGTVFAKQFLGADARAVRRGRRRGGRGNSFLGLPKFASHQKRSILPSQRAMGQPVILALIRQLVGADPHQNRGVNGLLGPGIRRRRGAGQQARQNNPCHRRMMPPDRIHFPPILRPEAGCKFRGPPSSGRIQTTRQPAASQGGRHFDAFHH